MSNLMHQNIEFVQLGYCSGVHGIKGGLVFTLFNSEDSVLKKGQEILLKQADKEPKIWVIADISFGNKVIVYLEGIKDRTDAEKLLPFSIYFPRESFPEIGDSEYYLTDLVGLEIFDHSTKKRLGKVLGFFENKKQVILSLTVNGEKMDLPFIKNFFPVIDLLGKRLEINLPEYI